MIPLHVHSNYSLLEGVITIDEILEKAVSYGISSVALTDTNGMYGLVSFYKKAKEIGINPILGTYIDEPEQNGHAELVCFRNNKFSKNILIVWNVLQKLD